ncbi:MAG: hypothetical protein QOI58_1847 [Thermoanaerobaculia bacterium]|jgi:hypothetical protein|nr:hypothetical protein [Thermoanaerobaculia bacterium]
MKSRVAAAVLIAIFSVGQLFAQADPRAEKRSVAIEVLKAIDSKHLTQSMIELLTIGMMDRTPDIASKMSTEEKARFDKQMTQQRQKMRTMLDRLFARIDYAKYDAEVYLPIFEKEYTTDELRELVAFYKTKAGQKTAHAIPELSIGAFVHGMQLLQQDAMDVEKEMAKEEEDKRPQWDRTMRDIRTIATATEAYMTDENKVPDVRDIAGLAKALEPTYVRTLPQTDGWGATYVFLVSSDRLHYRIVSKGADKRLEAGSDVLQTIADKVPPRKSNSLDDDFIYQDGDFVQYPAVADEKKND